MLGLLIRGMSSLEWCCSEMMKLYATKPEKGPVQVLQEQLVVSLEAGDGTQ